MIGAGVVFVVSNICVAAGIVIDLLCMVGWYSAEYGDFIEEEFGPDPSYAKYFGLLPQQSEESKCRLIDHHKEHA